MTNYIWVTAEREFMHHYPEAPRTVSFLRNEHRHNFKVKVWIQIFNEDRELEFIIFQRFIKGLLFKMPFNLQASSCEMLANNLYNKISEKYPNRIVKIDVSEDGENGAYMEYP